MLAVCRNTQVLYPCKSRLEAELEVIQTQALPGFGVYLFAQCHKPFKVLQIQGRKALVSLRNHKVWVQV